MFDFIKNIGPTEIIVLVLIVVIFFGSKVAIGIGKASGETVREIKKIKNELTGAMEDRDTDNQKEVSK